MFSVQVDTAYLTHFIEPSTVPEHTPELLSFNFNTKPTTFNKIIIPLTFSTCCYGNVSELMKHMLYLTYLIGFVIDIYEKGEIDFFSLS